MSEILKQQDDESLEKMKSVFEYRAEKYDGKERDLSLEILADIKTEQESRKQSK